ncbi:hypothetical protein [Streptomyces sp. NPDC019224]|uniref:hypothetical protein n=1 Tax=Streptomyces sp. NPDC019224 TaxID=3154484 RepID=UPI0033EFC074
MKLDMVLKEVHHGENALAVRLMRRSSTHTTDHEVHHVARDLAAWSRHHVREPADAASDHGVDLSPEPKTAQAARDQELLDLTERCHPQTLRQQRWANTMIKVVSPQVLTS